MQLHEYVEQVAEQIRASAALGDARTQEIAATLGGTAESAVRLAILNALSAAAGEVTVALLDSGAPGSPTVATHLDGEDVEFRVTLTADEPVDAPPTDDGDATARISLRLSENLKSDVERAAERESVSVNTWLVRAARAALTPAARNWGNPPGGGHHGRAAHRITGWVSG